MDALVLMVRVNITPSAFCPTLPPPPRISWPSAGDLCVESSLSLNLAPPRMAGRVDCCISLCLCCCCCCCRSVLLLVEAVYSGGGLKGIFKCQSGGEEKTISFKKFTVSAAAAAAVVGHCCCCCV